MKDIILIGGGGHCKSCIDVIETEGKFKIQGILDRAEDINKDVLGYPIIGTDEMLPIISKSIKYFLITIGFIKNASKRVIMYNFLNTFKVNLPTIIAPNAYVSRHSNIGIGTIIMHNAMINADSQIGVNCIINSKALIEHDARIGDHCHVSTGSIINGGVILGDRSFFGSGAIAKQYISIQPDSFIKANSIVK